MSIIASITKALTSAGLDIDLGELLKGKEFKRAEIENQLRDDFREVFKQEISDTQNARKMQENALKQSDLFSKRFIYFLTIGLVSVFSVVTLLPFFLDLPEKNEILITQGSDFVRQSALLVLAFFFGTKYNPKNTTNASI
mgnify:CR=1|tara:strand:+ start:270 stop:689 length:420 start_codon:yes stop_codon:yes gene_type:complete